MKVKWFDLQKNELSIAAVFSNEAHYNFINIKMLDRFL
jgi:hypothetical protein